MHAIEIVALHQWDEFKRVDARCVQCTQKSFLLLCGAPYSASSIEQKSSTICLIYIEREIVQFNFPFFPLYYRRSAIVVSSQLEDDSLVCLRTCAHAVGCAMICVSNNTKCIAYICYAHMYRNIQFNDRYRTSSTFLLLAFVCIITCMCVLDVSPPLLYVFDSSSTWRSRRKS